MFVIPHRGHFSPRDTKVWCYHVFHCKWQSWKNIGGSFRYKMAWKNYLLTTTLETHAKISMFRQHNSPTGRTSFKGKEKPENNYFWNIPFQILTQSKFFPTRYNVYSDRMWIYNLDNHFMSVIHIWENDKINNETF